MKIHSVPFTPKLLGFPLLFALFLSGFITSCNVSDPYGKFEGNPDNNAGDNQAPETPPEHHSIIAPGAGSALLETPKYQIRLIVGPQGGMERIETSNHKILMGAGNIQHNQQ